MFQGDDQKKNVKIVKCSDIGKAKKITGFSVYLSK